jgi:ribosome biogenesis GTPase A
MAAIQWFPGHMAKTNRELATSVKLADIVIEVLDARIPQSSGNPDFSGLFKDKRRLIILNKSDLADMSVSAAWKTHFKAQGTDAVFSNARDGTGLSSIVSALKAIREKKIEKRIEKGVVSRPVRAIIAGIPNSGKSSLINRLAKGSPAITGDKPGITRRRQWFRVGDGIELLDTPGILWPKFDNETVGLHLAYTGAIKDDVFDNIKVAGMMLLELARMYPANIIKRYGIDIAGIDEANVVEGCEINVEEGGETDDGAVGLLMAIGRKRGFLLRGGEIDLTRTAAMLLDEFRAGKIGGISLERPSHYSG